jgi:hypothetical protein
MKVIHVRTKVESDTLHLPELRELIGRPVEVLVVELAPATREEVFCEALYTPESPEGRAAQQAKFRTWRADPRYEHLWPMLDRLIDTLAAPVANGTPADAPLARPVQTSAGTVASAWSGTRPPSAATP